ncbi:response regulator [Candidatus Hydrogenedentota bacterium]
MMGSAKIMIVEDNSTVAEDCRDCLESFGYSVTSIVASGEESIERAEAERPNAVIMDINLRDEMDGIEAAGQIHDRFEIPVVFLSAYSDRKLLERAKRVGSFGYLVKPFEERELHATLEMALYKAKTDAERRRLEERTQQVQKLESLAVLAGGVAHDFNNLLAGILGYASLALDALTPDSPVRSMIEQIEKAGRKAAGLSQQMLAYSGQGNFIVEPIDLNEVITEMGHLLGSWVSRKVALTYDFAKGLSDTQADVAQIRQIVMSLVANATESLSEEPGTITISTDMVECDHDFFGETYLDENQAEGAYVRLKVTDTGCGMDEEMKAKLFDPFFTTKFTGRGLGLSAVLGIVRGHKGAIKVDSELGKGSTFTVLLPACERPAAGPPKVEAEETESWKGSGTILLVDDEEILRTIGKFTLERMGFTVLIACDGKEALNVYREHAANIVCVLLDLTMPHMDGEETFSELCKLNDDVRVVLSSGYNEREVSERFTARTPDGFLHKPYRSEELRDKLRAVLG